MGLIEAGSQTDAIARGLNMGSVSADILRLLERLEAAVGRLEMQRQALPLVLTVKAAAAQLSVSERTMRALLARGEVASVLVGGRRMVASAELQRVATPADAVATTKKTASRRPLGMDVDAELARADALRIGRRR